MTTWQWLRTAVAAVAVMVACASTITHAACSDTPPAVSLDEHVREVLARHQDALLAVPGVVGVGVGRDESTGAPVLRVYTAGLTAESRTLIPADLEGVPVHLMESGELRPR